MIYKFPNLAGKQYVNHSNVNLIVESELVAANISTLSLPLYFEGEVQTSIVGLGMLKAEVTFVFVRASKYWKVYGNLPLEIADYLYYQTGRIGLEEIRAGGNESYQPPKNFVEFVGPTGKLLVQNFGNENDKEIVNHTSQVILVKDPAKGIPVVRHYHIDSPEGLRLFSDVARRELLMA